MLFWICRNGDGLVSVVGWLVDSSKLRESLIMLMN